MRFIVLALKILCYVALLFVGSGIAALAYVNVMGGCPRLDEGAVQCNSPLYGTLGGYGLFVMLVSVFTGLPALLALGGLVLLIRGLWRAVRGPPKPPPPAWFG